MDKDIGHEHVQMLAELSEHPYYCKLHARYPAWLIGHAVENDLQNGRLLAIISVADSPVHNILSLLLFLQMVLRFQFSMIFMFCTLGTC